MIKGVIALLLIFFMMGIGMAELHREKWISGDGLEVIAAYSLQDNGDRMMVAFYVYDSNEPFEPREIFINIIPEYGLNKSMMTMGSII